MRRFRPLWTIMLVAMLALTTSGPARAQDSAVAESAPVSVPTDAEIAAAFAAQEADLAAQTGTAAERARPAFEQRLTMADNYLFHRRPADAARHWAAIRRLAPDDADGRGRIARVMLAEALAAVQGGAPPADVAGMVAAISGPCGDGESLVADVRPIAYGLEGLARNWPDLDDAGRLALLDASVTCHQPYSGDGPGQIIAIDDLVRLRLAADRPDEDYRSLLSTLERRIDLSNRSDDVGFFTESGRVENFDGARRHTGLYLDVLWRLESRRQPATTPGAPLSIYGLGSNGPVLLAQALDDSPANAALRRRAARRMAVYERNDTGVALIDEQARLIADHRLGRLRTAARLQTMGFSTALAGIVNGPMPDRVQQITRELGDLADIMMYRNHGVGLTSDMIRAREAVLLVVPTPSGTHSFLIRRTGQELWSRSALTRGEVHTLARQIRFHSGAEVEPNPAELARWGEQGFARDAAHRLYAELVAPFAAEIAALDHLVVIAGGPLEGLPFGLLVTEAPTGSSFDPRALRATRWFADAVPMSRMPTLQSFLLMRREQRAAAWAEEDERPRRPRPRGFLGLADPVLAGPDVACDVEALRGGALTRALPRDFAASATLVVSLRSLPRLPCTGPEAAAVAAASSGRRMLLTRADNIETRFHAADPGSAAILLFATHALMPGEMPGVIEPSLVLTPPTHAPDESVPSGDGVRFVEDGLLSASEIAQMQLSPDWIILSACNTGQGLARLGAQSSGGIVPYFFAAGAQRILATNWPLLDSSASDITTRAIRSAARGRMGGARALQQAMIAVRNDSSRDAHPGATLAHPMVWAAFELHGDGAALLNGAR